MPISAPFFLPIYTENRPLPHLFYTTHLIYNVSK